MAQLSQPELQAEFFDQYGPYGRQGAPTFNFVLEKTDKIKTVRISMGYIVDGIGFDILDKSGKTKTVWYGRRGHETTEIHMTDTEYVTQISGSHADFVSDGDQRNVAQIFIHTNIRPAGYGPYGAMMGCKNIVAFKAPPTQAAPVAGFLGRTGPAVQSIGVSVRKAG